MFVLVFNSGFVYVSKQTTDKAYSHANIIHRTLARFLRRKKNVS